MSEAHAFTPEDVDFLTQVASPLAAAGDYALDSRQGTASRAPLAEETLSLTGELRTEHNFAEIIGRSLALTSVLRDVETVAATEATVLVLGETGTGKELIARALHTRSSRRRGTPRLEAHDLTITHGKTRDRVRGGDRRLPTERPLPPYRRHGPWSRHVAPDRPRVLCSSREQMLEVEARHLVHHQIWETFAMRQIAEKNRGWSRWYWLFLVQCLAVLWPPFFNSSAPSLAGIPFFYWYQLLWVLIGAVLTAIVYFATRQ